jgi:hypothetical protein
MEAFTDQFCVERLDEEYAELCPRLIARLARRRPSPLLRGAPRVWAAGVLYAVGRANFIFDRSQPIHLSGGELAALTGVPTSTMAGKASRICNLIDLGPFDFEFSAAGLTPAQPVRLARRGRRDPSRCPMAPTGAPGGGATSGANPSLPSTEAA